PRRDFSLDATGGGAYAASKRLRDSCAPPSRASEACMCLRQRQFLSSVLLFLAASLPAQGEPPAEKKQPARLDRYGDPLPEGALVRMGTVRLRHHYGAITFASDGKTLISAGDDGAVRFWDVATGKQIKKTILQLPADPHAPIYRQTLSADGRVLAACGKEVLHLWDTATGKEIRRIPVGKLYLLR